MVAPVMMFLTAEISTKLYSSTLAAMVALMRIWTSIAMALTTARVDAPMIPVVRARRHSKIKSASTESLI